jgi:hypothetical protein
MTAQREAGLMIDALNALLLCSAMILSGENGYLDGETVEYRRQTYAVNEGGPAHRLVGTGPQIHQDQPRDIKAASNAARTWAWC